MSKKKKLGELVTDNKENAAKLDAADIKVSSDKDKTEKKISKLILDNNHISSELDAAYKIIVTQEKEIKKQAEALIRADKEKEKQRTDLISAQKELAHKAELIIVNKELNLQITKRKKSEAVVNLQKIKLELALQSSQMGTWEFNILENKHIFDNQACTLLGIDSATFGGTAKEFFAAVHPDDREKVKRVFKKIVEQGVCYEPEYRTIWRDGSIHNISARGNLLFDDKGKPQMISGIIWDNTENKQKEEALKNSEAKHSSMISNISDIIGIVGLDGLMKYKSPNIEKWFGWQPQDLIGTDGFLNVHPDDLERIQQEFVTLRKKENSTTEVEFRYRCKDGRYKPVELNAINLAHVPFIKGILLNFHDITERKQAELKLRDLTQIIENSLNEIYVFDTATLKFVYINQGALRNLGFSGEEILALTPVDIKPEFTTDSFLLAIEPLLTGKKDILNFETIHQRKNGTTYPVDIYLQLSEFEGKQVSVAIVLDITKRKQAESELIKAKEKAEESDRLKTAFMNNISHEIRTPLNGILGFAPFVIEPDISQEEKESMLEILNISCVRLINTVTDYMDIALIVSGNMKAYPKPMNLSRMMEEVYFHFQKRCSLKNLELKMNIPSNYEHFILTTDKELLTKILNHFVDNAIKFTQNGFVEFGYIQKSDSGQKEVELFVKDTGQGISSNAQKRIFDAFMQEDITNTRAHEGSGLGLSIAKGLTQLLGGKIMLESEKDKGTIVSIVLPCEACTEAEPDNVELIKDSNVEKSSMILIAEDDDLNYLFIKTVLRDSKVKLLKAVNGQEAVDLCHKHPEIDLVLMDIKMPVMNGIEATQQIKSFRKDLPIIAVTAFALAGDEHRFLEAGCDDYISKPIEAKKLIELVSKYLK